MSGKPVIRPSEDLNRDRSRQLLLGIGASFASRGITAIAPMLLIPILLPALGPSKYGAWMTIVSITAMLVWADLGLGSGLLTRLSGHLARNDFPSGRRDILLSYSMVGLVAAGLSAGALASPLFLSWAKILNTSAESEQDIAAIAVTTLVAFSVNMPLALIQRVQYAAEQVAISNAFTASGPAISLILALLAVSTVHSPVLIVAMASVGPLLANAAATLWFFSRNRTLLPRIADGRGSQPGAMLTLGGLFVMISLFSSLGNNSDSLIIARTLGAFSVSDYSVAARIMAAMGLLINLVNLPLWPATTNALSRGESAWVKRSTRTMAFLSASFVVLATITILAISKPLVRMLGHGLVQADILLLASLGLWWAVVAFTSPMMMVQNAAGILAPQLLGWILFLIVSLPVKIVAIPRLGLFAGPLTGVVFYAILVLPLTLWGYRLTISRAVAAQGDPPDSNPSPSG